MLNDHEQHGSLLLASGLLRRPPSALVGPAATFLAHTASPPPPSRTPAGPRASSRHASTENRASPFMMEFIRGFVPLGRFGASHACAELPARVPRETPVRQPENLVGTGTKRRGR